MKFICKAKLYNDTNCLNNITVEKDCLSFYCDKCHNSYVKKEFDFDKILNDIGNDNYKTSINVVNLQPKPVPVVRCQTNFNWDCLKKLDELKLLYTRSTYCNEWFYYKKCKVYLTNNIYNIKGKYEYEWFICTSKDGMSKLKYKISNAQLHDFLNDKPIIIDNISYNIIDFFNYKKRLEDFSIQIDEIQKIIGKCHFQNGLEMNWVFQNFTVKINKMSLEFFINGKNKKYENIVKFIKKNKAVQCDNNLVLQLQKCVVTEPLMQPAPKPIIKKEKLDIRLFNCLWLKIPSEIRFEYQACKKYGQSKKISPHVN